LSGRIESIHITAKEGEAIAIVESATAVAGAGIEGDRYAARAQRSEMEPKKQITFIEAEALEALERDYGIALTAAESRRNVCTRGIALNHLVGREFTAGAARLRGVELCEPCGLLERLSGTPGARKGLVHRGGLRAEILATGAIRAGDSVDPA